MSQQNQGNIREEGFVPYDGTVANNILAIDPVSSALVLPNATISNTLTCHGATHIYGNMTVDGNIINSNLRAGPSGTHIYGDIEIDGNIINYNLPVSYTHLTLPTIYSV